jgi:hypothetical protein
VLSFAATREHPCNSRVSGAVECPVRRTPAHATRVPNNDATHELHVTYTNLPTAYSMPNADRTGPWQFRSTSAARALSVRLRTAAAPAHRRLHGSLPSSVAPLRYTTRCPCCPLFVLSPASVCCLRACGGGRAACVRGTAQRTRLRRGTALLWAAGRSGGSGADRTDSVRRTTAKQRMPTRGPCAEAALEHRADGTGQARPAHCTALRHSGRTAAGRGGEQEAEEHE